MKQTRKSSGRKRTVILSDPTIPDYQPEDNSARLHSNSVPESNPNSPDAAARRLGRPDDESRRPEILPFEATLSFAFRGAGGRQTAIEYARLAAAGDKRFERFIFAYDRLSDTDRGVIRLEDLCAAAEITPSDFIGGIAAVAFRYNADISRLIAAVNHPRVTEATIEAATQPFGTDDRKILHTHSGFLPSPRAAQINISATAQAAALSQGGKAIGGGMPKFETDIIEVTEAVRGDASSKHIGHRLELPAVDAEFEEVKSD